MSFNKFTLSLIFFALFTSASAFAAPSPLKQIHALYDIYACGEFENGTFGCVDNRDRPFRVYDTITSIDRADEVFTNSSAICMRDSEGIKCALERQGFPLRELIASSKPGTMTMGSTSACGIQTDGTLLCQVPDWWQLKTRSFSYSPAQPIKTMGIGENRICWSDGTVVECQSSSSTVPFERISFAAQEIALTYEYICARNSTEAKCWKSSQELALSTDFLTAKKWVSGGQNLCAITADERLACVDWKTGAEDRTGKVQIPPEFQSAFHGLAHVIIYSGYTICAAFDGSKTAKCWPTYSGRATTEVQYDSEIVRLYPGPSASGCAFLKSGEFECRTEQGDLLYRMLKKSGPLHVTNDCYWNHSGVACPYTHQSLQSLVDVTAFASDSYNSRNCAIGALGPGGPRELRCSINGRIEVIPHSFSAPSKIFVGLYRACAVDGENLLCWGAEYKDVARPTVFQNVSRLEFGDMHACAIDDFGLVCWGDLNNYGLQVPSGLTQPGEVIDVAVGYGRTCALLSNQTVRCWGDVANANRLSIEALTGVTELIGSQSQTFCAKTSSGYTCSGGLSWIP